jgi:SAM-dependent methyltransferase
LRCPVCQSADLAVFFELPEVPVLCNVLWPERRQALDAPMGEIRLGFCDACGMIYNTAFDPLALDYDQAYENSLHFSPRFQAYAEELASRLVERHGLRGRTVVEIGCGKGDFLRLLAAAGNECVGFDTSFEGALEEPVGEGSIRVVRDLYGEKHAGLGGDLICCRHVLEHIPEPAGFLDQVRRAASAKAGAAIFFEVPNALWTLRDLGVWDVIYEHCSYYTAASIERAFQRAGFAPEAAYEAFGGQYLCLDAALADGPSRASTDARVGELAALVDRFAGHFREKVDHWSGRLAEIASRGGRVAIWGAGSKGVTFLNTVEGGRDVICAVDINARKQGRYVPGTGQEVVGPDRLARKGVDVVLVMNPLYADEIRRTLDGIGVSAAIEQV